MKLFLSFCAALILISCNKNEDLVPPPVKEPAHPEMIYTDLQNKEVSSGKVQVIDINHDGTNDFLFSTRDIGDPIYKVDKLRFSLYSGIYSSLLVGEQNESPVLNKGDLIRKEGQLPYEWFIVSEVEMTEKITGYEAPPYWQGGWKDVTHKFIAVQVTKEGSNYQGWIELSFDKQNDKMILHRTAICKEANAGVKAGI